MHNKNFLIKTVLFASIFGFLAGFAGDLYSRKILYKNFLNITDYDDINLSGGNFNIPKFVISEPKKVVIEQQEKIQNSLENIQKNIVGIYKKRKVASKKKDFDINNIYKRNGNVAEGLIITSDGWIATDFDFSKLRKDKAGKKYVVDNQFVVVAFDNKVNDIDSVVVDKLTGVVFFHINATDLPVLKFAKSNDIIRGENVISQNWQGKINISYISNIDYSGLDLVKNSDTAIKLISLSPAEAENNFSFMFDLSGDILAISSGGNIYPISIFSSAVRNFLENQEINRASLGLYFIELDKFADQNNNHKTGVQKGVVVYNNAGPAVVKDSTADIAGIEAGDIIVSINNVEVTDVNPLPQLVHDYLSGDTANLEIIRGGEIKDIKIKFLPIK